MAHTSKFFLIFSQIHIFHFLIQLMNLKTAKKNESKNFFLIKLKMLKKIN